MPFQLRLPGGREPWLARNVVEPFETLQREIDRVFDNFSHNRLGFHGGVLNLDVAESDKAIEISAELPGLEEKDVNVSFSDSTLTIRGEKKAEKEEKEKTYHVIERSYGAFSRSIPLPADIDASHIEATMTKGVLKITLPKRPGAAAKTIEIKPGA
jgi:HSP20 family protein